MFLQNVVPDYYNILLLNFPMDMNNFRQESHVAQQSRRDKLRNDHHASNPLNHHLGVHNINDMNHLPPGSLSYDPSEFCSDINYFHGKNENLSTTNNFNHPSDTVINRDPQSYFRTSTTDNCWVSANQTPDFVENGLSCSSSSFKIINSDNCPTMATLDGRPYNVGYQELHSAFGNNHQTGEISSPFYHNALQELVSTPGVRSFSPMGSLRQKSSEGTSHGSWVVNCGEHLLLPAYGDQSGLKGPDDLINRPAGAHQWNGELDHFAAGKNKYSHTQALSLSLSSVPSPKIHVTQIAERDNAMDLESKDVSACSNVQDFRIPNLPTGSNISRNARQEMMGTQALSTHRNPGPLGPFTGYATVLRSSKFLRPAQILLGELCRVAGPKNSEICGGIDKTLEEVRVSGEGVISDGEHGMKVIAGDSGGWMDCYRPEKFQEKAKLLYMQDEVCKRYKQYHQQMQMVVSSFESVAGLTDATPYVSSALKMVSKHFRCLKNAITDRLKSIRDGLGEELSSPSAGSKGNGASGSMLKFFDQSLQRQKGGSSNLLEGQHVWRPQRGLPERAVSVLRAWLFDHFLHPYPTDTDKHMLAIQTGLTRNQVSNWFINARVRVWKPMVEEIHMLETKGMSSDTRSDGKTTTNNAGQCSNTSKMLDDNYSSRVDNAPGRSIDASASWINQEKRSRIEYHHVPTSIIDGPLMGFVPSHQTVSLTLGLRQSAENGQRPRYGGRVVRDFVG